MPDPQTPDRIKQTREAALGGTGKVSGADPVADKQIPPARPEPHPPTAPAPSAFEQDSEHAIPLRTVQPDGSWGGGSGSDS